MKNLIYLFIFIPTFLFSQDLELGLASRNLWRGLNQGESPSIQADLCFNKSFFTLGTYTTQTTNGFNRGYGNTREVYFSVEPCKYFEITFDDYFFYEGQDYFNYKNHYPELRTTFKYQGFEFLSAFDLKYSSFYLELSKEICNFVASVGYVTGESGVNFYNSRGFCLVGLKYSKKINNHFTIEALIQANPNAKNISTVPGLPRRDLNEAIILKYSL